MERRDSKGGKSPELRAQPLLAAIPVPCPPPPPPSSELPAIVAITSVDCALGYGGKVTRSTGT